MALESGAGLAQWEIATIRKQVSEHRRRHRILEQWEFDDLVQECLLHWITIRHRIGPRDDGKPPVAYLAQVVRNKLTDLIRELLSDKRAGDPGALSLEGPVNGDEDDLTLGDILADSTSEDPAQSGIDLRDIRIDLRRALQGLTPAQQALCRLLGDEGASVKAASEQLGIPRGTLYEEINRIRQRFEAFGLDGYIRPRG
jgi:RNA polymerase sigma factor (sigma-70 family)